MADDMTLAMEARAKPPEADAAGGGALGASPSRLLALLATGPITIDELRRLLMLTRRDVEAEIERLRLQGEPIVASSAGLRLTDDPDELAHYVEARRRRLVSIYMGNRALRLAARRMRERGDLVLWRDVA